MELVRLVRAAKTKNLFLLWYLNVNTCIRETWILIWGYTCRFAIKSSIVGGSIYYTYTEGLWSKSEETAKLYEKLYANLAPYVKENIPEEVITEVISYLLFNAKRINLTLLLMFFAIKRYNIVSLHFLVDTYLIIYVLIY